ncbi:predicted protein [Chaetomium globosum CBS 148.51]|uniref:Uncharacterized protein n=1 Tax=Chaetomium globosum (strain ATCC 6205 / CBS 148.51 / DSM 1962 / NBRC 6347 / NRRL 1970) TaxID=306901 RepID=Q2GYP7_CHAGB|nr:uncharacterized protein CHGG_06907 [Chaetomium globosum CBS 148.51]EAQ85654.1 predicted protein [Chaetomium globosum CBS 148.51]
MGIDDLPVELTDQIIRPFCVHCSPTETEGPDDTEETRISFLASLCLLSRRLNITATPHLYHHLLPGRKWPLLARTLLTRNDLTKFPAALHFHDHWNADPSHSSPALKDYFTTHFHAWHESLSAAQQETFSWQLHDDRGLLYMFVVPFHDVTLDIITRMCPNLQTKTTTLHGDTTSLSALDLPSLRDILTSCPRLKTLQYAWGGYNVGEGGFGLVEAGEVVAGYGPASLGLFRVSVADEDVMWPEEWREEDVEEVRGRLAGRGAQLSQLSLVRQHSRTQGVLQLNVMPSQTSGLVQSQDEARSWNGQYCTMNGRLRRVASYKPLSGISSPPLSHTANQAPIG